MKTEKQLDEETRLKLKQDLVWIRGVRNQGTGSSYSCFGKPAKGCTDEDFICKLCKLLT